MIKPGERFEVLVQQRMKPRCRRACRHCSHNLYNRRGMRLAQWCFSWADVFAMWPRGHKALRVRKFYSTFHRQHTIQVSFYFANHVPVR